MLRVALAALVLVAGATPVVLTYAAADQPSRVEAVSAPTVPYSELSFDDGLLPGETGWFALPFTVDQPAYVRVEMDLFEYTTGAPFTMSQAIVAIEGRESWPYMSFGGYAPAPLLEVAHEGAEIVHCCDDVTTSWSMGTSGGRTPIYLEPGETLWVGLAAYQWTDSHDAWFTLSAQALLTQGVPRTGTTVEAVDLYDEAMSAGTRVRALSYAAQPVAGSVERAWHADGFGLFSVHAWRHDGDGRVTIEIPGIAPVASRIGEDGVFAAAHRAGDFRVALDELEGPAVSQWEWIEARAFFADIDIPGDVAFVYPMAE